MFFQCPKCKNVWQYPIEKCPECFLELKRVKSEKIKVIAVTKVSIPSVMHPEVPYFVLLLEDDKGNKWAQKSEKEYQAGEELKTEFSQDKKAVALWRVKYDVLEGIEKTIELLGGLNISQETKILILPTLVSPKHSYLADNTSPQFLHTAIKHFLSLGAKIENIKVAGQSFNDIAIGASAQKSGLLEVCQSFKILPFDLAQTNFIKEEKSGFNLEMSEEALKSDLIVNLPILKVKRASASENLLKVLKKENYLGLKYLYSEKEIISKLAGVLNNVFTLAEANMVHKPDQFTAFLGLTLAGFDALSLDRVFFELTAKKDLPEVLENIKIDNIPILGRRIGEVKCKLEQ